MSIQLTRPLVVPEFGNARVKAYIADPVTSVTVARPPYTIDVKAVLSSLIPGANPKVNACALNGNDLFIANTSANECILKVPNYLTRPELAIAQAFVFTLDGHDYVGMAFDAAGDLYATEGSFNDNHIVKYTGTAKPYPGPVAAAGNNFATRVDLGNAGAVSYFANLAFDAAGNLWASDYRNHRLVVFDAANLGGTNTHHTLANLTGSIAVANTNAALNATTTRLFAQPEGIDFDAAGNLWVANNNDGSGGVVATTRTSLVQITPALQAAVLATATGGTLTPTAAQSNSAYFIFQTPNLANNAGAKPQFGGLQIDRAAGRLYVNEQIAGKGRGYDIATIASIGTSTAANDLDIVSTNPGNGGIALVTVNAPVLYVRDDAADTGKEPNTVAVAWQSLDIWPRQNADGTNTGAGSLAEGILGNSQAHVYVRITNKGLSPSDGGEEIRLYWSKASAGLVMTASWDGTDPERGDEVNTAQPAPSIGPGQSALAHFVWPDTPNPVDYPDKDGHFCLLAHIVPVGSPKFAGIVGTSVLDNVLNLSTAAWRNIHVTGVLAKIDRGEPFELGALVAANGTRREMLTQIGFEILDTAARPIDPAAGQLLLTPNDETLERFRAHRAEPPFLEDMGHGVFRLLDVRRGIPPLPLRPGESLHIGLQYVPDEEMRGFAIRATQFSMDGRIRTTIGGQTFVAGEVEGLTGRQEPAPDKPY